MEIGYDVNDVMKGTAVCVTIAGPAVRDDTDGDRLIVGMAMHTIDDGTHDQPKPFVLHLNVDVAGAVIGSLFADARNAGRYRELIDWVRRAEAACLADQS